MENLLYGIGFALAALLLIWLGIRSRRSAQKGYESDVQRYTDSTMMTVVDLQQDTLETWEEQEDGTRVQSAMTRFTCPPMSMWWMGRPIAAAAARASAPGIWGGRCRAITIPRTPRISRRTGPESLFWAASFSLHLPPFCCFSP